jgi:hypothetical protein
MSYDRMNHGDWVQDNLNAIRRRKPSSRDRKAADAGRGWYGAPETLNAFHRRAFLILGVVGGGIYNAPIEWDSVEWRDDSLCLNWRNELATRDFRGLTDLVFLAHDAGIRISISPNMRNLRLILHCRARPPEGGSVCKGHPTLIAAVSDHRKRFPVDHAIHLENVGVNFDAPADPEGVENA